MVFYQLLLGASKSERATYQLDADPNKFAYLRSNSGKATNRRGEDQAEYKVTVGVLQMLKVTDDMITALFQTLSGLLALGSVLFSENPNGDSIVTSQCAPEPLAHGAERSQRVQSSVHHSRRCRARAAGPSSSARRTSWAPTSPCSSRRSARAP